MQKHHLEKCGGKGKSSARGIKKQVLQLLLMFYAFQVIWRVFSPSLNKHMGFWQLWQSHSVVHEQIKFSLLNLLM